MTERQLHGLSCLTNVINDWISVGIITSRIYSINLNKYSLTGKFMLQSNPAINNHVK